MPATEGRPRRAPGTASAIPPRQAPTETDPPPQGRRPRPPCRGRGARVLPCRSLVSGGEGTGIPPAAAPLCRPPELRRGLPRCRSAAASSLPSGRAPPAAGLRLSERRLPSSPMLSGRSGYCPKLHDPSKTASDLSGKHAGLNYVVCFNLG
ncbi:uncharacterized protein DKFZp434B061-like [Neopsephotus bourkii]|uniref:uncharacterized protein DKFZp434B061-like n=1 Tax=Neopsephotus bourkii TaxID=309878 RepID=UPI002AA57296|nr:uncharacterized protein DKFZp434B061-like [Neopsephotus bourkii]